MRSFFEVIYFYHPSERAVDLLAARPNKTKQNIRYQNTLYLIANIKRFSIHSCVSLGLGSPNEFTESSDVASIDLPGLAGLTKE